MCERSAVASLFSSALPQELSITESDFTRVVRPPWIEFAIDRALQELNSLGATILYPGHPDYPASFYQLEDPPKFLSCLGNIEALHVHRRLAIVGSREISTRCERWLETNLATLLRKSPDVSIISGGARGVDQAAHLAAIRAQRPTVVFLPSGLGRIFPADLRDWVSPVIEAGGVFVSAYAPHEEVRRFRFEARNRLIASLSQGLFVAEASRRSGSLMTARLAVELGRSLAVLPSFPGDPVGQGTLDLMMNGAQPICDVQDLATFVYGLIPGAAEGPARGDSEESVSEPHRDVRRELAFS